MDDKFNEIFSQYELNINNCYRLRGTLILETDDGIKMLRPAEGSENRLSFENSVKLHAAVQGFELVDTYVRNKEGNILSADSYEDLYYIKNWFIGDECDSHSPSSCCVAVKCLAELHKALCGFTHERAHLFIQPDIGTTIDKRIRECKRVKAYIHEKKQRNEFEQFFMKYYDEFLADAFKAKELLMSVPYEDFYKDSIASGSVCHGSFTYHSTIFCVDPDNTQQIAVTGFQKCCIGLQFTDLYQFLRKAMEKNNWDTAFGKSIIDAYSSVKPLSELELRLLYVLILFPEKFWKITNFYYNNRKSWISQKNLQKLKDIYEQQELKHIFLNQVLPQQ